MFDLEISLISRSSSFEFKLFASHLPNMDKGYSQVVGKLEVFDILWVISFTQSDRCTTGRQPYGFEAAWRLLFMR